MNRLKDLREDSDLTQEKMAEFLGCSQATYSRYEKGNINVPIDILKKLAEFYNVSIDYIMKLTNEKRPYKRIKSSENKK